MQTLQEVQKAFDLIGLGPKLEPFNRRILSILAFVILCNISQWIYLVHVTDSTETFMECMYLTFACSGIFLCFANTILTTEKLFSFFRSIDELSSESKCGLLYLLKF